jgi:hypothetical protein
VEVAASRLTGGFDSFVEAQTADATPLRWPAPEPKLPQTVIVE